MKCNVCVISKEDENNGYLHDPYERNIKMIGHDLHVQNNLGIFLQRYRLLIERNDCLSHLLGKWKQLLYMASYVHSMYQNNTKQRIRQIL